MADKIKKFFARKKEEAKFKLKVGGMGAGRKLNADSDASSSSSSKSSGKPSSYQPPKRKELSEEARTAAAAAMARIQAKPHTRDFNSSLAAIKAQVKRELENEQKLKEQFERAEAQKEQEAEKFNRNLACQGVYFRCPLISEEILSRDEWKVKIREFLYQQLEEELGLTACLIIQTCNNKEKAEGCIETISKYLENLINNPNEEKYHKIRINNRIFCDKVRYVEGALEFLRACGFTETKIDDEDYLVWSSSNLQSDNDLQMLYDALHNAEPIQLELDRNIQVLLPSQARKSELPADFYRVTIQDIKREQQLRAEALENAQILKTKAMREKEELRLINKYRFALIRVKFPNGIYLQGTFNVYDKINDVYEFVQSCLQDETMEFTLAAPAGLKFNDTDLNKTLYDLRLIPNTVLIFSSETPVSSDKNFLKEELLMLIQDM